MAHSAETRAAVMAALLEGQSVSEVAQKYNVPEKTIGRWRRDSKNGHLKRDVSELLFEFLTEALVTAKVLAVTVRDEKWIKKQGASEVAVLYGVNLDKIVRLLEALAPNETDEEAD